MTQNNYDVLIIGGGMVGASLACALAGQDLRIGLVEAAPLNVSEHPGYDDRSIALAQGTRRIFQTLGLWDALALTATPIRQIHISERGGIGFAHLDSRDQGVDALGYVAEARLIGAALRAQLPTLSGVDLLCPARLEQVVIKPEAAYATVHFFNEDRTVEIRAGLLVAADGAQSPVREQLGIAAVRWEYGQHAVIANITPTLPHENIAYERFTAAGPIALLPMSDQRCAVVCTVNDSEVPAVMALDDADFLSLVQERFGDRLGPFVRVGRRQSYPLFLLKAREHARARVAVIGNAAHTLHPIAGQGFNLGVRDVAALAEVVAEARRSGEDIGDLRVLSRYADWRRWDQRRTIAFTDALNRLFANPLWPVRAARNLGLLAFDLCPPLKRQLARQTMGLDGRLPKLARGLALTA
ncbi:2-octaprenyl-6-methoxyphenyl hydroxylase [Candidatus Contendibacter odensensis]|uniref:2-octaprenyl-6-methoxyphenol hydroxylase, FAD/NAD(P)-binding n=1 Tax=Candidatus Contendobacter odensis Run_B_J11 TaxID=1400861 RepID=A0A7U7G8J0_9GAMM|nr:2-octaprenyl-6-methoxyphenyl hydroxylase [Candidatus Contendobacter odensis]CDH43456.1 2-octaprenyl-6-methoxyphenol hydroxylase, FAD/NAD(P)-binding [Candidatus Contendobacter odensis Run_B_J11]